MARRDRKPAGKAAEHIKTVAQRLFADQGVDGVTVRDIAAAAGQKNHGAVGYYFGSKDALVRELVVDGARQIDERRNHMLDVMEARGGPISIREVVDALITPAIFGNGAPEKADCYVRFIAMLNMSHRDLFIGAIGEKWNAGYLRCLEHLRRLMPQMPKEAQNQRFVFMGGYLSSILAMREGALADRSRAHPTWSAKQTLNHFAQTVVALLESPYKPEAVNAAAASRKSRAKRFGFVAGPVG